MPSIAELLGSTIEGAVQAQGAASVGTDLHKAGLAAGRGWRAAARAMDQTHMSMVPLIDSSKQLLKVQKQTIKFAKQYETAYKKQVDVLKGVGNSTELVTRLSDDYALQLARQSDAANKATDAEKKLGDAQDKRSKKKPKARPPDEILDPGSTDIVLSDLFSKGAKKADKAISNPRRSFRQWRQAGKERKRAADLEAIGIKKLGGEQKKARLEIGKLLTSKVKLGKEGGTLSKVSEKLAGKFGHLAARLGPAAVLATAASEAWSGYNKTLAMTSKASERIINANIRLGQTTTDLKDGLASQATEATGVAQQTLEVAQATRAANRAAYQWHVDSDQLMAGLSTIASEVGTGWAELAANADDFALTMKKTGQSAESISGMMITMMNTQGKSTAQAIDEIGMLSAIARSGSRRQQDEYIKSRQAELAAVKKAKGAESAEYKKLAKDVEDGAKGIQGIFQKDFFNAINKVRTSTDTFHGSLKEVGVMFTMVQKRAADAGRSYDLAAKQAAGVMSALGGGLDEAFLTTNVNRVLERLEASSDQMTDEQKEALSIVQQTRGTPQAKAQLIKELGLLSTSAGMGVALDIAREAGGATNIDMLKSIFPGQDMASLAEIQKMLLEGMSGEMIKQRIEREKSDQETRESMQDQNVTALEVAQQQNGILEGSKALLQEIRDNIALSIQEGKLRAKQREAGLDVGGGGVMSELGGAVSGTEGFMDFMSRGGIVGTAGRGALDFAKDSFVYDQFTNKDSFTRNYTPWAALDYVPSASDAWKAIQTIMPGNATKDEINVNIKLQKDNLPVSSGRNQGG